MKKQAATLDVIDEASRRDQDLLVAMRERMGAHAILSSPSDVEAYEVSARHGRGRARAVVRPATVSDMTWVMQMLDAAGASMLVQGAATGLVAASTPTSDGMQWVISTQRLRDTLRIDPVNRSALVSAGFRLSEVNRAAAEHGLIFPIDLGADPTIGGMVATNTGGAKLIRYGGVRENLLDVEAVLAHPAGQIVGGGRALRKDNTGLSWSQLMCGTFGAFGIVCSAAIKLRAAPRQVATALLALDSAAEAMQVVVRLEAVLGDFVSACEGISGNALAAVIRHGVRSPFLELPRYALLVELSSSIALGGGVDLEALLIAWLESEASEGRLQDAVVDKPEQLWRLRHAISEAVQGSGKMVAFDVAVSRSRYGEFMAESVSLVGQVIPGAVSCDFGHLGDGGVHLNVIVPSETDELRTEGLRRQVYDLVVNQYGGSFSAEHGIGPYNQHWYDSYTPPQTRQLASALHAHFDPFRRLGNVRLD